MSTDATPRNGRAQSSPGELHTNLRPPHAQAGKIQPDESGSSGRTPNSGPAESSVTESRSFFDRFETLVDWIKDFLVPPRWLAQCPPGWDELTEFARGERVAGAPALVRFLSAVWLYAVVLPAVGKARIREWVLARFMRAVLFIGVIDLFIRTTPAGHWIADNLIRPWFSILAWIFLP